jgi:hypothetical protein
MSRIASALLVCLLATSCHVWADDAFPALDQRLGKTITVVEKSYPTEKAIITQVWRLDDGTPCMQAQILGSNMQLTLVENLQAKTAVDRIKIYRWTNGECPTGCPVPPSKPVVMETTKSAKSVETVKTMKDAQPAVSTASSAATSKVTAMDGGLVPVVPKKEEVKPITAVAGTTPAVASKPAQVEVAKVASTPVMKPSAVMMTTTPVKAPVTSSPAPVQSVPALSTAQSVPPVVTKTSAPVVPVQATTSSAATSTASAGRALVGGCEVITVTENGVARKYKVLGTARDKHGVMTHRCQALDNNEVVTLHCDQCSPCAQPKVECAAPVAKCEPVKTACPPAPCKVEVKACEPAKVVCAPAKPVCEPAKVACEPVKVCAPVSTKACDPCADSKAGICSKCGQAEGSCDDCRGKCSDGNCDDTGRRGRRIKGYRVRTDDINVPVPGVRLSASNGTPSGPPPQPEIPAFCTMNSSSIRAYYSAPQLVPFACLNPPFGDCMNAQISMGMYQMNHGQGDAVANTLYLINVLAQSKEVENRQWAAQRLEQATLPTVRPYVEDALMSAIQMDRSPAVKVAAIRTLTSLKSSRPAVVALLTQACLHEDPRIREAAGDALNQLMKQTGIQQAGYQR